MIMRPGQQQLLLPVNPRFLWGSLLAALLLAMVPLGRLAWLPDLLALVLVFWAVHQPQRIGIGTAFVFGLVMDVHQGTLLGQHALSYSLLAFCASLGHRRLLDYPLASQALQVLPVFVLSHAVGLAIRMLGGGVFPGWALALAPLIEAALWPLASALLLAPQLRTPEPDENRPL
ncbi:MAG: mreD [Variovorax sp.]|nr:mreD [Variovorax sp.]